MSANLVDATSGGSLTKAGNGTLVLTGANTFTGATTVKAGTLRLDFAAGGTGNILSASSSLVLGGGTFEIKGGSGEANTQAFTGTSGGGNLLLTQNSATSINLTLGAIATGSAINFTGSDATAGALSTTKNFLTTTAAGANNGSAILGGSLWKGNTWASTSNGGGATRVVGWTGTFASTLTTDGNNLTNPTGDLLIEGGSVAGTAATFSAPATIGSLLMRDATNATTVALGGNTLTVGNGGAATGAIAITPPGKSLTIGSTVGDGELTAGAFGNSTLVLNNASTVGATLTVNAAITDGASDSVALSTAGAVTLASANTHSGTTTLNSGVLTLADSNALLNNTLVASSGSLVFDQSVGSNAFTFGGLLRSFEHRSAKQRRVSRCDRTDGWEQQCRRFLLRSSFRDRFADQNERHRRQDHSPGRTPTPAAPLSALAHLAFSSGSLGTTGSITMNGGTLRWNGTNTQDISSRLVMQAGENATFDTNGNNVTFASAIGNSTTGAMIKTGAGTLTLSGVNTYTGGTTVEWRHPCARRLATVEHHRTSSRGTLDHREPAARVQPNQWGLGNATNFVTTININGGILNKVDARRITEELGGDHQYDGRPDQRKLSPFSPPMPA